MIGFGGAALALLIQSPPGEDLSALAKNYNLDSGEEVVWDDETGRYTVFLDSIFDANEDGNAARHAVFRIELPDSRMQTTSVLIDCPDRSWRGVWSAENGPGEYTRVRRRNYAMKALSPQEQSPMGAVIMAVCSAT